MNVVQAQIIEKEFKGKSPDDPKVKAREAEIEIYFDVVWKATEEPSEPPFVYPVGEIPETIMAWLPSNCFALLHPSERPQRPSLPPPKPAPVPKPVAAAPKPPTPPVANTGGKKTRGRQKGQTYQSGGLSRYNGEAVETPQGKISKISTDTDEKAATIQFCANELEEAMKKQRKFIRKQQAELVVLQQAAKEHHMNCQMVYTAVKMQAMWSESKVPQD